jgi:hypothetical protein
MFGLSDTVRAGVNNIAYHDNKLQHPTTHNGMEIARQIQGKRTDTLKQALKKAEDDIKKSAYNAERPIPAVPEKVSDDLNVDDEDDKEEDDKEDDGKCVIPPDKDIEFCDKSFWGTYNTKDKCEKKKRRLTQECKEADEKKRKNREYTIKQQLKTLGAKRKKKTKRRRRKRRITKKHRHKKRA